MPLPQFMLSTLFLLVVLILLYDKRALRGVGYKRYFNRTQAYEGDTVEMVEEIVNAKLLPLTWLRLESAVPAGLQFGSQENLSVSSGEISQNHNSLFYLKPYRHIRRRHTVTCAQRGIYLLESATMTTGDPLGFTKKVRRYPLELHLTVYPSCLELEDLPLPVHGWLGELPVKRWIMEDPFLQAGTREYAPGDPFHRIHWKASARTGILQVHKKGTTADSKLVVCLNVEDSAGMWRNATDISRIERGIRYAATVITYALHNGIQTGLISNGRLPGAEEREPAVVEPVYNQEALLAALAGLLLDRSLPMDRLIEERLEMGETSADYLLITCHRGPLLEAAAAKLEAAGNGVEWLMIPEEGGEGR